MKLIWKLHIFYYNELPIGEEKTGIPPRNARLDIEGFIRIMDLIDKMIDILYKLE
jgi:hypothetical protein